MSSPWENWKLACVALWPSFHKNLVKSLGNGPEKSPDCKLCIFMSSSRWAWEIENWHVCRIVHCVAELEVTAVGGCFSRWANNCSCSNVQMFKCSNAIVHVLRPSSTYNYCVKNWIGWNASFVSILLCCQKIIGQISSNWFIFWKAHDSISLET